MINFHFFQKKVQLRNEPLGMIYCNVFPEILLAIHENFDIVVGHEAESDTAVNVLAQEES